MAKQTDKPEESQGSEDKYEGWWNNPIFDTVLEAASLGQYDSETYNGQKAAPPKPDYESAADKQTQTNRPNFNNPFGSSEWHKDENGNWTHNTKFSPQFEGLFSNLSGQLNNSWSQPLDNGQGARQRAEDAIYSREVSRLDPMFNQRDQATRSQLESQGLDPNSEAYRRAMDDFGRSRNDAYQGAMNQSIIGGGSEAQRQMQMDLMSRNAPMQAISGLYGLASSNPNFMPGGNYLGAAQAQGDYDLGMYQAQNAADTDKTKALVSAIIAGLGLAL